jgi:type I restriction enzyme S subunit
MLSDFSATPKGQSLQDISLEGNSRNWCSLKLKWLASKITDGSHVSPDTENAVIPFVSTRDVRNGRIDFENCLSTTEESFQSMFRSGCSPMVGDILYSKDGTIGRTAIVLDARRFAVASSLIIIRPNEKRTSSKFLNYALSAPSTTSIVDSYVKGAGLPRLSIQNIQKVSVYVPSLTIQGKISTFLDRETNKIDQIIQKQERLIELLVEKRQAVISHAVTKGLDPSVPMKDSGVEWLGEIPAHWTIKPLKRWILKIEQGWSPECDGRLKEDFEWGVLKVGCVNGGEFNPMEHKTLPADLKPRPEYLVNLGDVLVSRANTRELVGSAAQVDRVLPQLLLCDKTFRIRTYPGLIGKFLVYILGSKLARQWIEINASGASASMQNIGQDTIRDMVVAIPSIGEQISINSYLMEQIASFQKVTAKAQESIRLMKERRSALISAAVTGKIDVREAA